MSNGPVRLAIAAAVLLLLLRASGVAWRNRALAVAVWRSVRPRHLAGAGTLLVVVAVTGYLLLAIPSLRIGLGELVGFAGNAVFTPLEEAASRTRAPDVGPDWALAGLATVFLGFLALLLPWLAFVEEEIFRAGLEATDRRGELLSAVRFGLVHMVVLVPLAAALAISIAGYAYGRVYRRAYRQAEEADLPGVVARVYRPTRRARRAAASARLRQLAAALPREEAHGTIATASSRDGRPATSATAPRQYATRETTATATRRAGARETTAVVPTRERGAPASAGARLEPEQRQAAAVLHSTVWHTTFNSLVVALLWGLIVLDALR
ncbi:MAG TPA: hypothetical protein VHF25_07550 [Nitriliruptorales bacterium]|nr:hypothetical protein [Nitriliruptorales bacterium]